MSLPRDTEQDPHADALLASVLRATDGAAAEGCPDAEVIGLFAEGALTGAELGTVEAHVQACPRCQAMVAAFVRALPDEPPVPNITTAAVGGGGFAAWFSGWRWLVPATSLAAVALVAVWVGRGPADQVAESARGPAAQVATGAAAPAAESAPTRQPEAFAPQAETSPSEVAGAATADARAKSALSVEARRKQAGALADRAAAANEAPAGAVVVGAPREAASDAAPAAARARTTTFSALTFTPWRSVDGRVERSRDNGTTWERVATPEGIRVITAGSPGGDVCWLVVEDGVLRTTNGRTWTRTTRPTSEPLTGVVPVSADRASVFTTSGGRWETTDGGRTWTPAP